MADSCSAKHAYQNQSQPLLLTARVRKTAPERFWIPVRPTLRAADGGARPNSGGTPFRQPCPAYPSTKGRKAPQERFSEESLRTSFIRKRVSLSLSLHCNSSVKSTTQQN